MKVGRGDIGKGGEMGFLDPCTISRHMKRVTNEFCDIK